MRYTSQWVDLSDSTRKFVHVWEPASAAKAVVSVVHGLGEHGGRYERLAAKLVESDFLVVAFDQTGHGRCSEIQGCIESYDGLLGDIELLVRWTQREFSGLPLALLGHSMGGNLVLNYVLRKSVLPQCVIASSPMIRTSREPGKLFEVLARCLMRIAPNYRLKSNVVAARLMSDPDEQRAFEEDQLFHNRLSLRLAAALLDSGRWLLQNTQRLTIPALVIHGTNDFLTSHEASSEFAFLAGDKCELAIYENQLHDTFRDLERERVISRMVEFIRSHSLRAVS